MITFKSVIETKNYTLKLLEENDRAFFLSLYQNKNLMSQIGNFDEEILFKSFNQAVKRNMQSTFRRLTYCIYSQEKRLGIISLMKSSALEGYCEIGIILASQFSKQGVAHETMQELINFGFYHLSITTIYANFSIYNDSVFKLVTKLGFKIEKPENEMHNCYLSKTFLKKNKEYCVLPQPQ